MLPGARLMELGQQECKTQTLTLSGATGNYAWRGLAAPNLLAYVKTRFEVQGLTVPEAAIYLASNPTFGDIVNVKITIRPQQGIHTVTLNIDDAAPLTSAQWYWPGQSALEAAQLVSASITYDCLDPKGETKLVRVEWPAPYASLPMLVQRAPTGERTSEAAIISRNNNTGSYTDDPGVGTWDYRLGYLGEWGPWAEIVVPPPAPCPIPTTGWTKCGTLTVAGLTVSAFKSGEWVLWPYSAFVAPDGIAAIALGSTDGSASRPVGVSIGGRWTVTPSWPRATTELECGAQQYFYSPNVRNVGLSMPLSTWEAGPTVTCPPPSYVSLVSCAPATYWGSACVAGAAHQVFAFGGDVRYRSVVNAMQRGPKPSLITVTDDSRIYTLDTFITGSSSQFEYWAANSPGGLSEDVGTWSAVSVVPGSGTLPHLGGCG